MTARMPPYNPASIGEQSWENARPIIVALLKWLCGATARIGSELDDLTGGGGGGGSSTTTGGGSRFVRHFLFMGS